MIGALEPPLRTLTVGLLFFRVVCCRSENLRPRTAAPAPISISPSEQWEGIDGQWNTVALRLGNPTQVVRVYVSTASQQTWAVAPIGCSGYDATQCDSRRGSDFNYNASSSWASQGTYELWIEANLGFDNSGDIGVFGYDTVGLGYQGEDGPTLDQQVVGVISTYDFYYGHFGINPKPTNWTDFNDPYPSYLTSLKNESQIPSISWAYTAGAQYRFAGVLSSLTLGGYDSSRFIANNLTIPLGSDNERDILPAIQSIRASGSGLQETGLIPSSFTDPIYAYIDSTIAEIWLPAEVCSVFEQTFNLTYDSTSQLYLVDDAVHSQLLATNPNITFTLGSQPTGGQTVDIVLPYSAFDLTANPPYRGLESSSRFFPLRRASNSTQYTLGRTFLQEAYVIVDWERRNFSVSQCSWVASGSQHIVPILPVNGTEPMRLNTTKSKVPGLGKAAIAGIIAGATAVAAVLAVCLFLLWRRRGKRKRQNQDGGKPTKTTSSEEGPEGGQKSQVFPKAELDAAQPVMMAGDGTYYKPRAPGTPIESEASSTWANPVEADSKEREIFEMLGDVPKTAEADSRSLGEKEALRLREGRYNGINPAPSPISPVSPSDRLRPSPVTSSEVVEVIGRVGPRGQQFPVSPVDGGSSDGSRTMLFSPLSPNESTNSPNTPSRRRFSYETDHSSS